MRKIGRFNMSVELVEEQWQELTGLFAHLVVLRCECRWDRRVFEYVALSVAFDEVDDTCVPPLYEVTASRFLPNSIPSFNFKRVVEDSAPLDVPLNSLEPRRRRLEIAPLPQVVALPEFKVTTKPVPPIQVAPPDGTFRGDGRTSRQYLQIQFNGDWIDCERRSDGWGVTEPCDIYRRKPAPAVRRNGGVICDVSEGPCACGAWH